MLESETRNKFKCEIYKPKWHKEQTENRERENIKSMFSILVSLSLNVIDIEVEFIACFF